ncbi:class I SAM-dependent DNA methyltransferase [Thermomonospora amylolytica]|uniref:class I SAM-dependent DNA methyltransferase n=1 Tax=Thermomonospora amylolytica TaxID=1411117 RepID=UPI000E6B6F49|nr:class I SAM-dependent methyltransferase [Thermomonospora amylolytica]
MIDFERATKAGYDAIAERYAEHFSGELWGKESDRDVLVAYAEGVRAAGGGKVADVGSGPGRVTAFLHELGLDVHGIDLSSAMVALARREHPHLRFEQGSMMALDLADGALAGLVAWYSIIHVVPDRLPEVFAEFGRVLAPGGRLLLAFQVGNEPLHFDEAFGHRVDLDFHRLDPERVTGLLAEAGFRVRTRLVRPPVGRESTHQAFIAARKHDERPAARRLTR